MSRTGAALCMGMLTCGVLLAQTVPQSDNEQLRQAETALEKNDFKAAAALLGTLARERPHDTQVFYDLGYADERINDAEGAKAAYMCAIAADPENAAAHVALGLLLVRTGLGSVAEAERELRSGADGAKAPADVRAHALRALATLEEPAQPAAAADDLLKAVQLTGETEEDIVQSADLAFRTGHDAEAETAYRRALAKSPDDLFAQSGLGQTLRHEGKLNEADQVLAAALVKHPNDTSLLATLATVKAAEGKSADAVALLEPLVTAGSAVQNPGVARELATLYVQSGQLAKAEALYGELVAAAPDDAPLLDDYADVLVREAKFSQAEPILRKAVANRSAWPNANDWAEAAGHLAFAASRNRQPEITLQALAARATVLPNSPATLFLQATAHDSLHQYKDALEAYRAFLLQAGGKFPDEEFEARHRIVALEHMR